jgi:Cellulase (glycosyl hydrolase family 5)
MQKTLALRQSPARRHALTALGLSGCGCILAVACGGSSSNGGEVDGGVGKSTQLGTADAGSTMNPDDSAVGTNPGDDTGVAPGGDSGTPTPAPASDAAVAGPNGGYPAGWLYTDGNKIMVSTGSTGTQWMGRGVNMDDIFLCGNNSTLADANPDAMQETEVDGLIKGWKPNFVRYSLSMDSFTKVSWLSDPAQYKTPVTNVVDAIGKNPGVYVLLTLRSDQSMILGAPGNTEPTGIPSDAQTTPDATMFPTGTDAVYTALVDTFAQASFVIFGLTNEPGGNARSDGTISAAMDHAVGTIRAEEDKLDVPHHLVSVQGNGYSSDLKLYTATPSPITHDNVIYELHYYPSGAGETPSNYQYSTTLPMIVGEYGSFTTQVPQSGFYADMEAKMIPNLAWDFDPFSGCAPDLLNVTHDATKLQPTAWGTSVQTYLLAHAP